MEQFGQYKNLKKITLPAHFPRPAELGPYVNFYCISSPSQVFSTVSLRTVTTTPHPKVPIDWAPNPVPGDVSQ